MKRLLISILVIALLPALVLAQAAGGSIGQIVALQGTATAVGADGKSRPLALKSPLFMKDKLVTEAGSRLQILFIDESTIAQGEKSELVIDEYVFAPGKKEDNACSLSLTRGVFRVVTDKITKLNPARFKVKTKMATIGIRGCDLGFEVGPDEEHIYVIMLQGNERIIVERLRSASETRRRGFLGFLQHLPWIRSEGNAVEVEDSRTMIIIRMGWPMDQLRIPWDVLLRFIEAVRVQPGTALIPGASHVPALSATRSSFSGTRETGGTGTAGETGGTSPSGSAGSGTGTGTPEQEPAGGTLQDVFLTMVASPTVMQIAQPDPPPQTPPELPPAPSPVVLQADALPPAEPPPTTVTKTFTPKGGGTDWSWGVWMLNGLPDSVSFTSAKLLPATDFQAIASGGHLYNLSGAGSAAAVIQHNGSASLVEGTCAVNIQVGASVTPNWDGTFTMANGTGDRLNFEAVGAILTGGKFTGNEIYYLMHVHGVDFNSASITAQSIGGRMVGAGAVAAPSGAVGSFSFSHGAAAQVNGGFGADVTESPIP